MAHATKNMQRLDVVFGTRPEAVKLAPLVAALRACPGFAVRVVLTAQHREMLDQVLALFALKGDVDLDLMRPNQQVATFCARAVAGLHEVFHKNPPRCVIVQGDTTTAFAACLAAFYAKVPVAHVEAGLRSNDLYQPFPEEVNRVLIAHVARFHFAPTARAKDNLLREGIPADRIFVTGNTGIDALMTVAAQTTSLPAILDGRVADRHRIVFVTVHRRENHGAGIVRIRKALCALARRFDDVRFVLPVHPNPNVRSALAGLEKVAGCVLCDPLDYRDAVAVMKRATLVITDSGGVQEEAPALGKPVLVLREVTERPEGVAAGTAKLVGTDTARIVAEATRLLTSPAAYQHMAHAVNPYGDGKACARIVAAFRRELLGEKGVGCKEFTVPDGPTRRRTPR